MANLNIANSGTDVLVDIGSDARKFVVRSFVDFIEDENGDTAYAVFKGRCCDMDQNTTNPTKEPGSHRCEECGGSYGVHWAYDMSGIGCWACASCDDGTLSIA